MREKFEGRAAGMMRIVAISVIGGMALWCAAFATATRAQKEEKISGTTIQRVEQYRGTATLQDKAGKARAVRVAVSQWTILGQQRVPEFREQGFAVMQLNGGKVTTEIDGKTEKRRAGDTWVVPANTKMSLDTKGENATIEVTVVNIP